MKKTELRMRRLLARILDWDDNNCYFDDDLNEEVIDGTEADVYNYVMRDDEIHLLGTETVKKIIHLYYTDYHSFTELCMEHRAH